MKTLKKIFKAFIACFTSKYELYRIIAFISVIVRTVVFPLIFPDAIEPVVTFFIAKLPFPESANKIIAWVVLFLANTFIISNILHFTTYWTVGNFYQSRTDGTFGSWSYLCIYTLQLISLTVGIRFFVWAAIIPLLCAYVIMCGALYWTSFSIVKPIKVTNTYVPTQFETGYTLPFDWELRLPLHIFVFLCAATGIILLKIYVF